MSRRPDFPDHVQCVLRHEGIDAPELLGKGGEGHTFALSETTAIKIYGDAPRGYLDQIAELHAILDRHDLPFQTPCIYEVRSVGDALYTVEKRLSGVPMERARANAADADRRAMLASYLDAATALGYVVAPNHPYGDAIRRPEAETADTWTAYLLTVLDGSWDVSKDRLAREMENVEALIERLRAFLGERAAFNEKSLVHGDYFPGQVLIGEDSRVSAVLDFGVLSVVGDPRMDIAGAIGFLELAENFTPEDTAFLRERLLRGRDADDMRLIDAYIAYYAVFWAESHRWSDKALYEWCLRTLRETFGRF